jgi:hypothetical protein
MPSSTTSLTLSPRCLPYIRSSRQAMMLQIRWYTAQTRTHSSLRKVKSWKLCSITTMPASIHFISRCVISYGSVVIYADKITVSLSASNIYPSGSSRLCEPGERKISVLPNQLYTVFNLYIRLTSFYSLSGHNFQVVFRSDEGDGFWNPDNASAISTFPSTPMRRDVLMVRPQGNFVIRFTADNPGIWLFHCHIDWHLASGLAAVMVEAPEEIQQNMVIPEDHYQVCHDSGTPIAGNAAGNTKDALNLNGENKSPAPLPAGFTARGIVALVFSCLSAFVGMGFIAW